MKAVPGAESKSFTESFTPTSRTCEHRSRGPERA